MATGEGQEVVQDGNANLVPAVSGTFMTSFPPQPLFAWDSRTQPAATGPQPQPGEVKLEDEPMQGTVPVTTECTVDPVSGYFVEEVCSQPPHVPDTVPQPQPQVIANPTPGTPVPISATIPTPIPAAVIATPTPTPLHSEYSQPPVVVAPAQGIPGPAPQPLMVSPVTLEDLRNALTQFVVERDWEKFHTPRNLLCALVGEVGELSEIFQWRGEVESGLTGFSDEEKAHVAQELADVLLYLIRLADVCGFDLGQAALNKLQLNAQKYPPELCRGSAAKYTAYNDHRHKYEAPPRTKSEDETGRKRQRERFTDDQVQAMTLLAERAGWSITAISWEDRVKFCEEYGVTKERLSNFFNNRKPKEMKKGRTPRATPQMHDSSTQATPLEDASKMMHAAMASQVMAQVTPPVIQLPTVPLHSQAISEGIPHPAHPVHAVHVPPQPQELQHVQTVPVEQQNAHQQVNQTATT